MLLSEFIRSTKTAEWLQEPGIEYYVRKSIQYPGLIELSNCVAPPDSDQFGLYRFLKRYKDIMFSMENVLNPQLADYMRRLKWRERDTWGIPQFMSPNAVECFKQTEAFIWQFDRPADISSLCP